MSLLNFQTYLEMSRRSLGVDSDTSRFPAGIDKDDIRYLKQFDVTDWPTAKVKRYEKLWEAIKDLHKRRKEELKSSGLQDKIENYLRSNGEENKDDLPKEVIDEIEKEGVLGNIQEKDFEKQAHSFAFYYVKEKINDIDEEKYKIRIGSTPYLNKNFYLNTLYHKLEKTRGEEHVEEFLKGTLGKIGHDLTHPVEDEVDGKKRKRTRGLDYEVFSNKNAWRRMLIDFLQHSSHGHFGKPLIIPGKKVEWRPASDMTSRGSGNIKDPTFEWMYEPAVKKQEKLMLLEKKKDSSARSLTKEEKEEAREIVNKKFIELINSKKLHAPFIKDVPNETRFYKTKGEVDKKGNLIVDAPDLLIPHIEQEDGSWSPILNPSSYLKEIKPHTTEKDSDSGLSTLVVNPDHSKGVEQKKQSLKSYTGVDQPIHHSDEISHPVWDKYDVTHPEQMHLGDPTGVKTFGLKANQSNPSKTFWDPSGKGKLVKQALENSANSNNGIIPEFDIVVRRGQGGGSNSSLKDIFKKDIDLRKAASNELYLTALSDLGNPQLDPNQPLNKKGFRDGWMDWANTKFSSWLQYPGKPPLSIQGYDGYTRKKGYITTSGAVDSETGNQDLDAGQTVNKDSGVRQRGDKIHTPFSKMDRKQLEDEYKKTVQKYMDLDKEQSSSLSSAIKKAHERGDLLKELEKILPKLVGQEKAQEYINNWKEEDNLDHNVVLRTLGLATQEIQRKKSVDIVSQKPTIKKPVSSPLLSRVKKPVGKTPEEEISQEWSLSEKVSYYKNKLKEQIQNEF